MNELFEMLKEIKIGELTEPGFSACLNSYTEKQLEDLVYEYKDELDEGQDLISSLERCILNSVEKELTYVGDEGAVRLEEEAGNPLDLDNEIFIYLALNYRTIGWVYFMEKGDTLELVMPLEIRSAIAQFRNSEEKQKKARKVREMTSYMQALLNLYGVFEKEQFLHVWNSSQDEELTAAELEEFLIQNAKLTGDFWCDMDYIITDVYENKADYISFINSRLTDKYYCPGKSEIALYRREGTDTESVSYKELRKYLRLKLKKETTVEEMLYELINSNIMEGNPAGMVDLIQVYGIEFDSKKDIEEFIRLYTEWYNHARLKINRGFTAEELGKPKQLIIPFAAEQNIPIKSSKTGRNDPCPCGSGKKFKKCCGK